MARCLWPQAAAIEAALLMIQLSSNIRTQATADGGVILDLRRGKMFRINPTGATILNLLAHGSTEKQIVEEICHKFSAPAEVATTDVRAFLGSLADLQLLQRESTD
jgi:hypothetical protein